MTDAEQIAALQQQIATLTQEVIDCERSMLQQTEIFDAESNKLDQRRINAEHERDEAQNARAKTQGDNLALLRKLDLLEQRVIALTQALSTIQNAVNDEYLTSTLLRSVVRAALDATTERERAPL